MMRVNHRETDLTTMIVASTTTSRGYCTGVACSSLLPALVWRVAV